ncbi:MAG: DUF349 domain-containing protein [Candidatus Ancillula trichonymphae]|jgi:hypothetical protein|nr:DUF349 domain-containing protein [Candidatus Ancillula trichonymphae]
MNRAKTDSERVVHARTFGHVDDEGRVFVRLPKVGASSAAEPSPSPVPNLGPQIAAVSAKPEEETNWKFVGQYVTGEVDETMELFVRRFVNQLNKCDMLEERLEMPELNITTSEIDAAIKAFHSFLDVKNAVGDYEEFSSRLERITKLGDARKEYNRRAKKETIENAMSSLREMTDRLEGLLMGNLDDINWKAVSPLIDNAIDDWKGVRQSLRLPEKESNELWERFITARKKLGVLRSTYFTNLKSVQVRIQDRKNRIIEEARSLQDTEDFTSGLRAFRRLQKEWTEVGCGLRRIDQAQWEEFGKIKDHFYGRLTEYNNSRENAADDNDFGNSRRSRKEQPQWNNDLSHLSNTAFDADTLEELKRKFEVDKK